MAAPFDSTGPMIQNVIVLGAGSAGLMAALAIKRKFPAVERSRPSRPRPGRDRRRGKHHAQRPALPVRIPAHRPPALLRPSPTHLENRASIFSGERDPISNTRSCSSSMPSGPICRWPTATTARTISPSPRFRSALMAQGKAFRRAPNGAPDFRDHAYHIFNPDYVKALEMVGTRMGHRIHRRLDAGHRARSRTASRRFC